MDDSAARVAAAFTCPRCNTLVSCSGVETDSALTGSCPSCSTVFSVANQAQFQGFSPPVVGGFHDRHARQHARYTASGHPGTRSEAFVVAREAEEPSPASVANAEGLAQSQAAVDPAAPPESQLQVAVSDLSVAFKRAMHG